MAKAALILFTFFISFLANAEILSSTKNDRFFRVKIAAEKGLVKISRKSDHVSIRTLDVSLGKLLKDEFDKFPVEKKFISEVKTSNNTIENFTEVIIKLSDINIEAYNFYRDMENAYVIDFWNDNINESLRPQKKKTEKPVEVSSQPKAKKKKSLAKKEKKQEVAVKARPEPPERSHLDFRYGAAFIWDYEPLLPELQTTVTLDTKTPEYFYQVKDRDIDKSEAEAHLQLVINLYRDQKYGLMYKAIKLLREKHGQKIGADITDFMQANALLKDNIKKGNREPVKPAISMLENIGHKTKDYDLKKGILKYLGIYYRSTGDNVKALQIAKRLYVISKENFDYEESKLAAEKILYFIAKLNQLNDLDKLSRDKTIVKLLPTQSLLAYKFYVMLKQGKTDQIINEYEKLEASIAKPIHHGILFNLAEAYFREGKYSEAISSFDDFVKYYSYHNYADQARVRLALSYDILEKDYNQTAELYKNAINRSTQKKIQYEAKVRLVGLQYIRKLNPTEADKELEVFLDRKSNENFELGDELEQLLWLVRLRTFVKSENYDKALSYLKAIPINSMMQSKTRSFLSDGVEIVSGLILKKHLEDRHHIVVRLWEVFSVRYFSSVALDPYISYVVGKSYLELGFYDSFEKLMARFEKFKNLPPRTYPRWRKTSSPKKIEEYIAILKLNKNMKLENWQQAEEINEKELKKYPLYEFYRGVLLFKQGKHAKAVTSLEGFITSKSNLKLDETQQSEFYEAYTESLHNLGKVAKFQKVVSTIIQQKSLSKNDNFAVRVFERAYYLYLENLNKLGSKQDYAKLEASSLEFISQFQNSSYTEKVKYLLGLAYAKNLKDKNAEEVFQQIINDETTSKSVKELARTELTLINLKNKKL